MITRRTLLKTAAAAAATTLIPAPAIAQGSKKITFLTWNITQRGSRVRFRTQEVDYQIPEEANVYTILRYLATVVPVQGKALPAPDHENVFQVVFSLAPERLVEAGWDLDEDNIRVLSVVKGTALTSVVN